MDLVEMETAPRVRHPWEEARARFFLRVLREAAVVGAGAPVLDVGGGDGWLARQLAAAFPEAGPVSCWDSGYTDEVLSGAAFAEGERISFTRERPRGVFRLVLLLDVLEHVEDDGAFLSDVVRENVAAGGHALVSVPAWPALYSAYDRLLRHHRRYSRDAARRLIDVAGLDVVETGGVFTSLLAVRALQVALERLGWSKRPPSHAGQWSGPAFLTRVVRAALSCDTRLALTGARLGIAVPGLSHWALCRKPSR